jgi:hypothetical protein
MWVLLAMEKAAPYLLVGPLVQNHLQMYASFDTLLILCPKPKE